MAGSGGHDLEGPIHQSFGVGPGHQHPGVYQQVQSVKGFVPGDVGQRLTGAAAVRGRGESLKSAFRQCVGVVGQKPGALMRGAAQRVQQQQLCVQPIQPQRGAVPLGLGDGQSVHVLRKVKLPAQ